MFSPLPTPIASPFSLNAACTGQLRNQRLLYLIFLGRGMVGSVGFKREAPNCNKTSQANRHDRLPCCVNDRPQQSSALSFFFLMLSIVILERVVFSRLPLISRRMRLDKSWDFTDLGSTAESVTGRQLWRSSRSLSLCVSITHREAAWPSQIATEILSNRMKRYLLKRWKHQLSL